jgi:hypothetical protein
LFAGASIPPQEIAKDRILFGRGCRRLESPVVEFATGGCFGAELGNPFLDTSLFPALLRTFYVMSKNHVIQIVMIKPVDMPESVPLF